MPRPQRPTLPWPERTCRTTGRDAWSAQFFIPTTPALPRPRAGVLLDHAVGMATKPCKCLMDVDPHTLT
jgi:hypothetical protein